MTSLQADWGTVELRDKKFFEFENGIWTGKKPPYLECRIMRNTNFDDDGLLDYSDVAKIPIEARLLQRKKLAKGDILIERSGGGPSQPVGRAAYFGGAETDFCFSNFTSRLRVINRALVPRFVHYFLFYLHASGRTEKLQRRTTGIRNLDFNEYLKTSVPLPPIQEQRSIVRMLDTAYRAKMVRLKELLLQRERRFGLMEYLFSHGAYGEQQKDSAVGRVPRNWTVKPLAHLADIHSGGTPSKANKDWWSGGIPWASPKDMKRPRLRDVRDHISDEALREGSRLGPAKSIFIAVRGMILAKEVPICLTEVPMAFNQDIKAISSHDGVNPDFLLYALHSQREALAPHIGTSAHGTRRIGGDAIATLNIPVPAIEEQSLIAQMLLACDNQIEFLEREVVLLRELFEGLLEETMSRRLSAEPLNQECGQIDE